MTVDLFGSPVTSASAGKSKALRRSAQRMAEWRKTADYQRWLIESRDRRKQLREKYRRQKGIKSRSEWSAEIASAKDKERLARLEKENSMKLHAAHVLAWKKAMPGRWWKHKYDNDSEFNAQQKMRARLRKLTKGDSEVARLLASYAKSGRWTSGWSDLLGYDLKTLTDHLRRMVPKGKTWQDFLAGRLQIDHIIPRSSFDVGTLDGIKACWCLSNLQLLSQKDNLKKRDKVESLL